MLVPAVQSEPATPKTFDTFTLYWENDTFARTDRDYTNGVKLTWSTPFAVGPQDERNLPRWSYPIINRLPFVNDTSLQRAVSISIGQNIYTPEDTQQRELIIDDRPYAGFTYFSVGFHSNNTRRRDIWEFDIGIVGPHAYAEETQNFVHDLIDSRRAKGWDNQLQDELGLAIICESKWRVLHPESERGFGCDLIPHLGGRAGNIAIYANTGVEFRIGWSLPRDFGSCPIRPGCEVRSGFVGRETGDALGIHFFTHIDGRMVLYDVFLDGNTFRDSHSVDKKSFVADLMAGIALEYGRFKLSYSYIYRTKQFEEQDEAQVFGAFHIAFHL